MRPVGAELFHADRQTDGRANIRVLILFFAVLRPRMKISTLINMTSSILSQLIHRPCQKHGAFYVNFKCDSVKRNYGEA
jgi:hypothetical protein